MSNILLDLHLTHKKIEMLLCLKVLHCIRLKDQGKFVCFEESEILSFPFPCSSCFFIILVVKTIK